MTANLIISLCGPSRGTCFWSAPPECEIVTAEYRIEAIAACWRSDTMPADVAWRLDAVRRPGSLDVDMEASHPEVVWAWGVRVRATGERMIVGDMIAWEAATAHLAAWGI